MIDNVRRWLDNFEDWGNRIALYCGNKDVDILSYPRCGTWTNKEFKLT